MVAGPDKVPVPLCVAVKLVRKPAGLLGLQKAKLSGATRGLATFGLMEIEAVDFPDDIPAMNTMLLDLSAYLIEAGPVLKHGDTVGPDGTTKMLVRHLESIADGGRRVYRVSPAR